MEKALEQKWPALGGSGPGAIAGLAPKVRAQSVGVRGSFVPKKVYAQGFYDRDKSAGALSIQHWDELAETLTQNIQPELKNKFTLETRYQKTRRLVFSTDVGGESCWEFREKLLDAIAAGGPLQENGKDLKVRVQDALEMENKRGKFCRAVDAIKKFAKEEEDFILNPRAFCIYDAKEFEPLGTTTEALFQWDADALRKHIPSIDVPKLRRATIMMSRRA